METFGVAVGGEHDDFLDWQPEHGDDDFMSGGEDLLHQQPGQGEEEEDYSMPDADEDEEYPFPAHAPPAAAASEAAIAALEASEAPADDCCPICLHDDGVEAPVPWRRVAPCGHRFHGACVEKWLWVKLTCPVCRCPAAAVPELPTIPEMVEFLAMDYNMNPRWIEYIAGLLHQE